MTCTHLNLTCQERQPGTLDADTIVRVISSLTKMKMLKVEEVVENIPDCVGAMLGLERLELGMFPEEGPATVLPSSLMQCTNLTHLSLAQLPLATAAKWGRLNQSWQGLTNLKTLHIEEAEVRYVPDKSWVFPTQLQSLTIDRCSLRKIPKAGERLRKLVHISIDVYGASSEECDASSEDDAPSE